MFRPVLVTAPAAEPISKAEVKAHLRVDSDEEDDLIEALIDAAIAHLDGWSGVLGRCLITQTWRQDFEYWQSEMRLPFPDVASVTVAYTDEEGGDQTLAAEYYELLEDARGAFVRLLPTFPSPGLTDARSDRVRVQFVTGYGGAVPVSIKQAMLLLIGHWYANRESVSAGTMTSVPMAFDSLIAPHRRMSV